MDFSRCDITWTHVGLAWALTATVLTLAYVAARKGWLR